MNLDLMAYILEIIYQIKKKKSIRNKFRRIGKYWYTLGFFIC